MTFGRSTPDPPAHRSLLHVALSLTHCYRRARSKTSKSAAHFKSSIPLMDIPRQLPKSPGLPRSIPCSWPVNQHHNTPLPHTATSCPGVRLAGLPGMPIKRKPALCCHSESAFRCHLMYRLHEEHRKRVWFGGWQV